MTRREQQLVKDLEDIKAHYGGDPERAHYIADRDLLAYIGSDEVTAAFDALEKWYA